MKVFAAIQQERTGRVYTILSDEIYSYYWLRASPEQPVYGPFDSLTELFGSMAQHEGHTIDHWAEVFSHFYPQIRVSSVIASALSV
jgi:hypothetical protein